MEKFASAHDNLHDAHNITKLKVEHWNQEQKNQAAALHLHKQDTETKMRWLQEQIDQQGRTGMATGSNTSANHSMSVNNTIDVAAIVHASSVTNPQFAEAFNDAQVMYVQQTQQMQGGSTNGAAGAEPAVEDTAPPVGDEDANDADDAGDANDGTDANDGGAGKGGTKDQREVEGDDQSGEEQDQ